MFSLDFANINEAVSNHIIPFNLEKSSVRGRLIRLEKQIHHILSGHRYPPVVSQALGELVVNTAMLGSMFKLEGILSIQVTGNGAVKFMSADYTSEGHIRGYSHIRDREAVVKTGAKKTEQPHLKDVFGTGHMVVTIETNNYAPYQAIIPLEGSSLTHCIMNYFKSSDQLDSDIVVLVQKCNKVWRAGGILIQKIPDEGGNHSPQHLKQVQKIWKKAKWALANFDPESLCQARLVPDQLLETLFGAKDLELFSGIAIQAKCRCSRERMRAALAMLSAVERKTLLKKGIYHVTCQICNKTEDFTEEEVIGV
jgi:molecular chaperone Hsp33